MRGGNAQPVAKVVEPHPFRPRNGPTASPPSAALASPACAHSVAPCALGSVPPPPEPRPSREHRAQRSRRGRNEPANESSARRGAEVSDQYGQCRPVSRSTSHPRSARDTPEKRVPGRARGALLSWQGLGSARARPRSVPRRRERTERVPPNRRASRAVQASSIA